VWEKIQEFVSDFLGKLWWLRGEKRRSNNKSVCLSRVYRGSKSNVHPTFGISNGQRKHERNEWQGKVLLGGLILHRHMRKGKRPPTPPPTKCHKICFGLFIIVARKLPTLQPSIPSPCVEISQAHLDGRSQAPKPESGHLGLTFPSSSLVQFSLHMYLLCMGVI